MQYSSDVIYCCSLEERKKNLSTTWQELNEKNSKESNHDIASKAYKYHLEVH